MDQNHMEIEKKFRVEDARQFDSLTGLDALGGYSLRQTPQPEQQHNAYYDTPDRLLQQRHYGLRLRTINGHSIATLKGPNEGQDDVARRGEWEVEANDPDPHTWPESEARTQALALIGSASLVPLLTMHTQRRHIIALRDGQEIAELSLDQGSIYAGGQQEDFCELEIELLSAGTDADIEALETALRDYLPLLPEHRSKLQRGLDLLQAAGMV